MRVSGNWIRVYLLKGKKEKKKKKKKKLIVDVGAALDCD